MTGRIRARTASAVLVGVLAIGGCSATEPLDLAPDAAALLQDAVHGVAAAAAQGRYEAAAVALGQVRAALDAAVEAGDVSVYRYREIDRAIQRTAAELEAAAADATQEAATGPAAEPTTPSPDPAPSSGDSKHDDGEKDAGKGSRGNGSPPGVPARGKGQDKDD